VSDGGVESEREKSMGTYVTDGENEIGVALTDSWAAVWTVDTQYIEVIRRDFWDEHADEIKAAAEKGRDFTDEDGNNGTVAVIGTDGDLDDEGFPKEFGDASEYVADELSSWTRSDGGAYERATVEGYTY
jgi:hypothetical protein